MSVYLDNLGIKSVVGLNKWFKDELFRQTGRIIEMEAVKIDKGIILFWAIDDKLHRNEMRCPTIYTLQEKDIKEAIEKVSKTLLG